MSRVWIGLRSLIYATLFLVAWGWVALLCRGLDRDIPWRLPVWLAIPGAVLFVAGAALAFTTIFLFIFVGWGTPAIFDPPKRFVPRGPYKIIRNPMYVGGAAMLLGWALYLGSMAMALFALLAWLVFHTYVVFAEEPGLRKRFGREYEDFCRTVPRWIPGTSHHPSKE